MQWLIIGESGFVCIIVRISVWYWTTAC